MGKSSIARYSAVALLCASGMSHGQMIQNITLGNPKALALGHAVTADPPGLDSIHFNPAGLSKLRHRGQQFKVMAAQMEITSETGDQRNSPDDVAEFERLNGMDFPVDDQANRKETATKPMLILPFEGMTKVPAIIAPFGGAWMESQSLGVTFATTAYTPAAFGFERDRNTDPGSYQGYEVALTRLTYLSPSVGIQVSDTLSFGLSIGLSWQGFGTRTKFRAPEQTLAFLEGATAQLNEAIPEEDALTVLGAHDNVGDLTLEMEDVLSTSFNVGVLWEPTPWLAFGLVYQSEAKADMSGDFTMRYSDEFYGTTTDLKPISPALALFDGAEFAATPSQEGGVEMEMTMPQHLSIGTSIKLLPDLKVNVDVKWTDYSAWDTFTITFDQNVDFLNLASVINTLGSGYGVEDNADPNELRLPRGYEAVTSWALGVEYQWNDNTVIRFGYEPRGSAVPDDKVDFLVPISDATLYSFGFGYQIDAESRMDVGVAYLHSEFDADVRWEEREDGTIEAIGESSNANDTTPGQVVYNPYAFLPISGETNAYIIAFSYDQYF